MADPIDDLEITLAKSVPGDLLPSLFSAIDEWRHHHGGCRAYIARHSIHRRHQTIVKLSQDGLAVGEVAARVGVTPKHVRHVNARTSSYLG